MKEEFVKISNGADGCPAGFMTHPGLLELMLVLLLLCWLVAAYRVLSDPERREKYDVYGIADEQGFAYVAIGAIVHLNVGYLEFLLTVLCCLLSVQQLRRGSSFRERRRGGLADELGGPHCGAGRGRHPDRRHAAQPHQAAEKRREVDGCCHVEE